LAPIPAEMPSGHAPNSVAASAELGPILFSRPYRGSG